MRSGPVKEAAFPGATGCDRDGAQEDEAARLRCQRGDTGADVYTAARSSKHSGVLMDVMRSEFDGLEAASLVYGSYG